MNNLTPLLQNIENKNLLVIFPHPDDESFTTGSLLLTAKRLGFKTSLLTLTKGEYGKSNIKKGRDLADKRVKELKEASKVLKIDELEISNLKDGYIKEDIENLEKIVEAHIKKVKPGLVVTYDMGGFTGHPDHITVSKAVLKTCRFLDIPLLFYVPSELTKKLSINLAHEYSNTPEYVLRSFFNFRKANAFFKHECQLDQNSIFRNISIYIFLLFASENYHLVDFNKTYPSQYFPFQFE